MKLLKKFLNLSKINYQEEEIIFEIFENSVTFKKIFKNPLVIPHVCFSNAYRIQQNAQAEQVTDYVVRQLFELSIVEIL